jgi:hypothetical protein
MRADAMFSPVAGLRAMLVSLIELDARAVVLNLSGAMPIQCNADWEALCRVKIPQPMALVVPPGDLAELQRYCFDACFAGLVRGPFSDERDALEWAGRCREHWAHHPGAPESLGYRRAVRTLPHAYLPVDSQFSELL